MKQNGLWKHRLEMNAGYFNPGRSHCYSIHCVGAGTRQQAPERISVHTHQNPATRNRTRDHLIAAEVYSQMLYQLSYSRRCGNVASQVRNHFHERAQPAASARKHSNGKLLRPRGQGRWPTGSLECKIGASGWRVKHTPGQDRAGDLQRVRLMS